MSKLTAGLIALFLILSFAQGVIHDLQPRLPACEEDAVLIGDGSFAAGRWDHYRCGPSVDDLPA